MTASSPKNAGFSITYPQIQYNRQCRPILTSLTSAIGEAEVKWQLGFESDFARSKGNWRV
ncbi:MAG: hypothetical protein ACKVP0_17410 [Pirellulaceae bacterium]